MYTGRETVTCVYSQENNYPSLKGVISDGAVLANLQFWACAEVVTLCLWTGGKPLLRYTWRDRAEVTLGETRGHCWLAPRHLAVLSLLTGWETPHTQGSDAAQPYLQSKFQTKAVCFKDTGGKGLGKQSFFWMVNLLTPSSRGCQREHYCSREMARTGKAARLLKARVWR